MSLVSAVITDIRVEIGDTASTKFTDDTTVILPLVKQAIRRANRICQRAQLQFAKKKATLSTVAGQNYVTMPADLDVPIGLWRTDLKTKIEQKAEQDWQEIFTADELAAWFLDLENSKILLTGTPATVISLDLWYFPTVDPSTYTVGSTMPWGGKLDDIIARYVALRIQNIDEMDTAADQTILQDMEASIVSVYAPQSPTMIPMKGWL